MISKGFKAKLGYFFTRRDYCEFFQITYSRGRGYPFNQILLLRTIQYCPFKFEIYLVDWIFPETKPVSVLSFFQRTRKVLKFHRFPFVEKRNNVRVELKLFKKRLLA